VDTPYIRVQEGKRAGKGGNGRYGRNDLYLHGRAHSGKQKIAALEVCMHAVTSRQADRH